jgi:DNA-directed RNA polymerase subunit K/omega
MDRTKVMELSEKTGGLFRLAVLLQKRVQELVAGAPKLIETKETNPIDIAMMEVEQDAIELVDLSEAELEQLKEQSQMASDEAELLEALRTRMSSTLASQPLEAPKVAEVAAPAVKDAPKDAPKEEAEAKPESKAKAKTKAKAEVEAEPKVTVDAEPEAKADADAGSEDDAG